MSIVHRYSGTVLSAGLAVEEQQEWHWENQMFGADRRVGDHVDPSWYGFCTCPRLHQLLIERGTTKTRRPLGGKTLFALKRVTAGARVGGRRSTVRWVYYCRGHCLMSLRVFPRNVRP